MKYTDNYNLKKPEGSDMVNIDDLNEKADIIDQKLKELEDGVYNAPPNSVNDLAIGTRTPNQTQVPTSPGSGTLSQILSWLANRINVITGKTNWWEDPPTTLQAAKNHIDAAAPHSGHETPAGAQEKADAALNSAKQYTDQEVAEVSQALDAHKAAAAPHSGHETPAGAQAKAEAAAGAVQAELDAHLADNNNPHGVTKTQVGLGNVDNVKQVPITRKINNKELSQDIMLSASDVGAETPAGAQDKADAAEANAKNHANELVGSLSSLATTAKNNIVAAINEIYNSGNEPPADVQEKIDAAEANAKAYTDAHEQKAAPHSGHETPAGAQEKADAALNSAKQYTDQEVAEVSQALDAHEQEAAPHSGHETPAGAQAKAEAAAGAVQAELDAHSAEIAIHKTSDAIRTETTTPIKVEVVSSSVSETPDAGRIIFDTSQGKFFGGNSTEWV